MDDRRLIEGLRARDSKACAQLVRDHYAAIYRLLAHLTRDVHAAEDLCQETFAAGWRKIGSFAGESSIATWLHRIAYRRFLGWRPAPQPLPPGGEVCGPPRRSRR